MWAVLREELAFGLAALHFLPLSVISVGLRKGLAETELRC